MSETNTTMRLEFQFRYASDTKEVYFQVLYTVNKHSVYHALDKTANQNSRLQRHRDQPEVWNSDQGRLNKPVENIYQ